MRTATRDEFDRAFREMSGAAHRSWAQTFGQFQSTEGWAPSVNLYQLPDRIDVCVDLAGMSPSDIDVQVEPGRLRIRGVRPAPTPEREEGEAMRLLAMEIAHGPFCRTISLPRNIDSRAVTSEYLGGMLWVRLPLRAGE